MDIMLPLLLAAAPAAVTGLAVGAAKAFGNVIGKGAGDATVGGITGVVQNVQRWGGQSQPGQTQGGQPMSNGSGQQRVVLMTQNGPVY
jgi:hypothetical protein